MGLSHLPHAEVEHGADVDDQEESADNGESKHWRGNILCKRESKRKRKKDENEEKVINKKRKRMRKKKNLKSWLDNSPHWEKRKPPRWFPASSPRPL